jgi:hypothetical protein
MLGWNISILNLLISVHIELYFKRKKIRFVGYYDLWIVIKVRRKTFWGESIINE